MKRLCGAVAVMAATCTVLFAQVNQTGLVFSFVGLKSPDHLQAETRVLENRLLTELVRLGVQEDFTISTPQNRERLLNEAVFSPSGSAINASAFSISPAGTRGIIVGQLAQSGPTFYLTLSLFKAEGLARVNTIQESADIFEALLGKTRLAVYTLFALETPEQGLALQNLPSHRIAGAVPLQESRSWAAAVVSLGDLVGSWRGDKGIQTITVKPDGTALADLGGWNTMKLLAKIEGDQIIIQQAEPNSPKLYAGSFPYAVAVQISELARPMRWVFSLSKDKTMLRGIKETTFFKIEKGRVVSADNTYSREASWTKVR